MSDDPRIELLEQAARLRNRDYASTRKLAENYDEIGVAGEAAFAREFRLYHDLRDRPGGDAGIDFVAPLLFTVDVKTSPTPGHLLVKHGKVVADIYVLAEYRENMLDAELLGWAWKAEVLAAPVIDWHGIMNHDIERAWLRPMSELKERAGTLRPFGART